MKAKELIKLLVMCDGDAEVFVPLGEDLGDADVELEDVLQISVTGGRSVSVPSSNNDHYRHRVYIFLKQEHEEGHS
jgi:hypothetical protein